MSNYVRPPGEPNPFAAVDPDEPGSTPGTALEWFLARAQTNYAIVRHSFLVQGVGPATKPGPLRSLVQLRAPLPLDLYLLRLALARVSGIEKVSLRVWARLLSTPNNQVHQPAVSRALARLDALDLARARTHGRSVGIDLLAEDGSGESYEVPRGQDDENRYTVLPFDYWLPGVSTEHYAPASPPAQALKVAGKAMLLALLKETSGREFVELTVERASSTYGFSSNTVDRGLTQLNQQQLQDTHYRTKTAHADGSGKGIYTYRALNHPFSRHHRKALQAKAKAEGDRARQRSTTPGKEVTP